MTKSFLKVQIIHDIREYRRSPLLAIQTANSPKLYFAIDWSPPHSLHSLGLDYYYYYYYI